MLGTKEFWDSQYHGLLSRKQKNQRRNKDAPIKWVIFEWLHSWQELKPYVVPHIQSKLVNSNQFNILNIGCGNSELGDQIWLDRLGNVFNIDYSEDIIVYMNERFDSMYRAKENSENLLCSYQSMDGRDMKFQDETFDLILDKGTFDAIVISAGDNSENIPKYINECIRVLKSGGIYTCITYGDEESRLQILKQLGKTRWEFKIKYTTVDKNKEVGGNAANKKLDNKKTKKQVDDLDTNYIYIMQKT